MPNRLEIDREIVKGTNIKEVARMFSIQNYSSLWNHSREHISRQLAQVYDKRDTEQNFDLLAKIDTIISRAEDIFLRNYKKGADITALKALDSQRNTIELLAKISYALHQAKLAELEIARQQSGEIDQESVAAYQKSLGVLNNNELSFLIKIQEKLQTQDKKIVVIPDDAPSLINGKPRIGYHKVRYDAVEEVETESEPEPDYFSEQRVHLIPSEQIPNSSKSSMVRVRRRF